MSTGRKRVIGLLLLAVVIGVAWYWWQARPPKPLWVSEPVQRRDVLETVSVVGRIEPTEYVDLSLPTIGTVIKLPFEQGMVLQRGDTIAVLDTSVLESGLRKAQVALLIAEKSEQLAHRHWDDLKPEERAIKKLTTKQAREDVQTIVSQIQESRIVAPFDGTLSKLDIKVGETVGAGRIIGRISESQRFILKADVPESDIAQVVPGKLASVTFDALSSDERFSASVFAVESSSTVIQDVIYYTVTFMLEQQDERLKEGMSADIDVMVSERTQVLTVPYRALFREGGQVFVEVAQSETVSERRSVEVGVEGDDGITEVVSGLMEGERVVVGKVK